MKKQNPKILLLDIETAPLLAYVWRLWAIDSIGANQIKSDWYILSWSAKWLGKDKVFYADQRNAKDIENDAPILEKLWTLMDEADIIVGHNLDKFDIKKLNTRFLMGGLQPPSGYLTHDTLKMAKKKFAFTSNRLSYLTDKLCKTFKKDSHAKYSGFELWSECIKGNKSAWKEMEKYNKMDVLSLEELYHILLPWDSTINFTVFNGECSCGSTEFVSNGLKYKKAGVYRRLRCKHCGKEYHEKQNLMDKDQKIRS